MIPGTVVMKPKVLKRVIAVTVSMRWIGLPVMTSLQMLMNLMNHSSGRKSLDMDTTDVTTPISQAIDRDTYPAVTSKPTLLPDPPLYPGSDISIFIAHLLIFKFAIKHKLTGKALQELLQVLSVFFPTNLCSTLHTFKKFFLSRFPQYRPVPQSYCPSCHKLLDSTERCVECRVAPGKFMIAARFPA